MKQDPSYTKFAARFASRKRDTLNDEVRFLDTIFRKKGIKRVLDLPCGAGRVSFPLAQLGYDVVGADLSRNLIREAKRRAKEEGLNVSFHVSDMRNVRVPGRFDAVINWWSSFLYLENTEDMMRALNSANRKLRKGGLILIDVASIWNGLLTGDYKPCLWDEPVRNGVISRCDIKLDPFDQFTVQDETYVEYANGRIKSKTHYVRNKFVMTPSLFKALFAATGFKTVAFYSDYDVRSKLPKKGIERLIAVAEKI